MYSGSGRACLLISPDFLLDTFASSTFFRLLHSHGNIRRSSHIPPGNQEEFGKSVNSFNFQFKIFSRQPSFLHLSLAIFIETFPSVQPLIRWRFATHLRQDICQLNEIYCNFLEENLQDVNEFWKKKKRKRFFNYIFYISLLKLLLICFLYMFFFSSGVFIQN